MGGSIDTAGGAGTAGTTDAASDGAWASEAQSALLDAQAEKFGSGRLVGDLSVEARLDRLAGLPLFRDMTPEELVPLAAASKVVSFLPGEAIVRQGEPGDSVYVILDGRVEVLAHIERNGVQTESVVSWLVAGDALGELSLLDGQPRSATCIAMTSTTCLCLGRDEFLGAVKRHWSLTHSLLEVVAERLRHADRRLAEHATYALTGVNNRRALHDMYDRETSRAQRAARQGGLATMQPLGILFADVNHFKAINDTYGHHVGDEVLCAVAQALIAASRSTDFVARYGGDEFIVLLPDAGQGGVDVVASRVRAALEDNPPGPVPFTVSLGSAIVDTLHPQRLEDVMAQADEAMYRDKARAHAAGK
jgi:diguanylate cyclase (GGDEF)-like protein